MEKDIHNDITGQSEAALQQKIFFYFWNKYPLLRGCLCYNNNNSVGGRRGKMNQTLGIIKGRSDLVLYYYGEAYMLELKTEKGYQRAEQKVWQNLMEKQGFEYYIIRSLKEFKKLIEIIIDEHK